MRVKIKHRRKSNEFCIFCLIKVTALIILFTVETGFVFSQNTEITFNFNPPNGTTFIETERITKELRVVGNPDSEAKISEGKLKYVINRTDFGYSVRITPENTDFEVAEDVSGILESLKASLVITYNLDKNGRLKNVQGVEEGLKRIKDDSPLPDEMWDLIMSTGFSGMTLEEVMSYNWNNRGMFGFLVGETLSINQVYSLNGQLPLPDGSALQSSFEIKIPGMRNCYGKQCAQVRMSAESDDSIVGERLNELLKNMMLGIINILLPPEKATDAFNEIPRIDVYNSKVSSTNERLIDPKTGLLYSEIDTRTIYLTMKIEGESEQDVKIYEKHEYSYNFTK